MNGYRRLIEVDRIRIKDFLILGLSQTQIADKLNRGGIVEGLNNKVKLTMRKSYGFKTFKAIEIALYHSLGKLPEPPLITHRFF